MSTGSNIAPLATVTASSQNVATGQLAIKAVDGIVDGYPGDYTREWATNGERAGAWITLSWSAPYVVDQIVLHDRPNANDQVTGGTLAFSDGSTISVGSLANDGASVAVPFTSRTITSVTFTITSVSNSARNIGLSEIEVYGVQAATATPPAAPTGLTATAISASQINLAWTDNATNETAYRIERSLDGTTLTLLTMPGANVSTYADTGLTASTTYYYRVLASNSAGSSAYSNGRPNRDLILDVDGSRGRSGDFNLLSPIADRRASGAVRALNP
jgi:hypothetical protein